MVQYIDGCSITCHHILIPASRMKLKGEEELLFSQAHIHFHSHRIGQTSVTQGGLGNVVFELSQNVHKIDGVMT